MEIGVVDDNEWESLLILGLSHTHGKIFKVPVTSALSIDPLLKLYKLYLDELVSVSAKVN